MIPFLILISIATTITTTCLAYDPEMYLKENDNFGGTKEDYYMNDFKGQYRYSFENPNTIKQFQDGFANGDKVGFYAFVGPDKRFYVTCYTAINGYRAKSIIVVTDMPYDDLQDFCQKKFNVVTNSFEDLSDVKKFIENKKNTEITTSTSTTTTLKHVNNKISVPITKVKGESVDKIIVENSSGGGGIVTSGKIVTDSGISSNIDISSSGRIRGKSDISVGTRSSDDHSVTVNENSNTNLKLTEKSSSSSSSRGRTRGRGKERGNKNIAVEEIKRGGKASIITGDVPTHLNIQIDVPQESGANKRIHSKTVGKSSQRTSSANSRQKTKQVIKAPDANIELVGGKIPLTDTKKHEPETEILIPITVKSSTNSEKSDTIFSTIGTIEKNSGIETIETTSGNIPQHKIELLDIPIPDEVYFPESLSPHALFDPTNGKGSGGSTTITTPSGVSKKEKVSVSNIVTEKSKSPIAATGINKISVDTTRGKSFVEISSSSQPSIDIHTEKIVPSKTKGKLEKTVVQQNIVTSELTKGKTTSQTTVGVNVNEKSESIKNSRTNQKLIIEESVSQKTKDDSTNTVHEPLTSIGLGVLQNTKTNTVLTSNKHENNDITIQPSIAKTNIPALENSVVPTPALEITKIIGMRGSASFSTNGRGGSAGSDNRGNENGSRGSGSITIGGNVSGGSTSRGSGAYVSGSGGAGDNIKYTGSGITIGGNVSGGSTSSGSGAYVSGSGGASDNIKYTGSGIIATGSAGHISGGGAIISGSGLNGNGNADGSGSCSRNGCGNNKSGTEKTAFTSGNEISGANISGKGSGGAISVGSGLNGGGPGFTIGNGGTGTNINGNKFGGSVTSSTGNNVRGGGNVGGVGGSGGSGSSGNGNFGGNGFNSGIIVDNGFSSSSGKGAGGGGGIGGSGSGGSGSGGSGSGGSGRGDSGSGGSGSGGSGSGGSGSGGSGSGGSGSSGSSTLSSNGFSSGIIVDKTFSSSSGRGTGGGGGSGGSSSTANGNNGSGTIGGNGFNSGIIVDKGFSSSSGGGGSGSGFGFGINPNQCVGQLVTKVVTQPAQTVTVTIQPTQTQKSTVSVPTALSGNSCRAKIVVEDSNKKLLVLHPTEAEMESIRERAAKSLNCGHLTFLSK